MTLVHWDDVPSVDGVGVGLRRVRLGDGEPLAQPYAHAGDEEIVHVLGGAGTLWQDGRTCPIGPGDTAVFAAGGPLHTAIGGDGGLDALVFETRRRPESRRDGAFADGEPGDAPANLRRLEDAPSEYGGIARYLARGLGRLTGLNRFALPAGEEGAPPHCHSADEELFVVLEGDGFLELWHPAHPEHAVQSEPQETLALRPGHVVSRPPASRVPHSFRAGPNGLMYLAYGTREPNDLCWYPRSNKVYLRGLGVMARLELLSYADGEPE
ncbi:MAG: cupin domain-containing protein [Actinomycetota bacterium]